LKNKGFTIGELITVLLLVMIVVVLLQPFVRQMSEKMDKVTCANNLRALGRGIYIYAKENNGEFPETVKTLFDDGYLADIRIVDCPASKQQGTLTDLDYEYKQEMSVKAPSMETLINDKEGNHSAGANRLTVNGKVIWKER